MRLNSSDLGSPDPGPRGPITPVVSSPSLVSGPLPSQEATASTLRLLMRLHAHQVDSAGDDDGLGRPPHFWLAGPVGCGKSYVAEESAMRSGLPWIRADLAGYAVTGQTGRILEGIFQELADSSRGPSFDGNGPAIVILEGIDREIQLGSGERGRALQSEVTSLLNGRRLPVRVGGRITMTSSRRVQFILPFTSPDPASACRQIGFGPSAMDPRASVGMHALHEAGIPASLLDATSACLTLPALDRVDLDALLLHADGGLAGIRRLLAEEGMQLELSPDARDWISREAIALGRGGHGLLQVLSRITPTLVSTLATLPTVVATVRVTSSYLNGLQPSPDGIAGIRHPVSLGHRTNASKAAYHPDFPPESLPHRPTRPTKSGASSQGRLARLSDLNPWLA